MHKKTMLTVAKNSIAAVPLNLGLPVKPQYLWLETTDRCNSRCVTCNIWRKLPTSFSDLFSLDDLRRCLTDPLMRKVKYILNSGGEATLSNLEGFLYVEHSALPQATLQISSNALLPDRLADAVQYAMDIGVKRLDVGLSIDGIGEAHDNVRGVKGNFTKLSYALNLLAALKQSYPSFLVLQLKLLRR